jgi:hypothetical protein
MNGKKSKAEFFHMLAEAVRNTQAQPVNTQPESVRDTQPEPKRKMQPRNTRPAPKGGKNQKSSPLGRWCHTQNCRAMVVSDVGAWQFFLLAPVTKGGEYFCSSADLGFRDAEHLLRPPQQRARLAAAAERLVRPRGKAQKDYERLKAERLAGAAKSEDKKRS